MSSTRQKIPVHSLVLAENIWTLPYLSLGMILAYLRVHAEGRLQQHYDFHPLRPGGTAEFPLEAIYDDFGEQDAGIFLLSSYVWNHAVNLDAAAQIKHRYPDALIIIGGPQIPKYPGDTEAFLLDYPFIDIAILGEGEVSCGEVLDAVASKNDLSGLAAVDGIAYRFEDRISRTQSRQRVNNLNQFPSPYLTHEFEPWFRDFPTTILETNRGCPFGCTYCDWGSATLQKVAKFDLQRIQQEIEYLAKTCAETIFIADANFGMLEQDIDVAKAIVAAYQTTGYPRRVYTNFAKNGGRRLMEVIRILHEGGLLPVGIIALQTTDKDVLQAIDRDNIKTEAYARQMEYFNAHNIPMASDIMVGLPGQTCSSLATDLQFCFDWKLAANGNFTSLMPNAPMAEAEYREKFAIETDARGMVIATSTFSHADLLQMKALFLAYHFFVRLGTMKYALYCLQCDYQVPAIKVLEQWLHAVQTEPDTLPHSSAVYEQVLRVNERKGDWALLSWGEEASSVFRNITGLAEEFLQFVQSCFGVELEQSVKETLVLTQQAVVPNPDRIYPYEIDVPHDITAYVSQIRTVACLATEDAVAINLRDFRDARLAVDADKKHQLGTCYQQIDGHSDDWELASALRFY